MYRSKQNTTDSISSPQQIFELYLFVNPIGYKCYRTEQEVLKFMSSLDGPKVHFRFITFHNFNTVTQYMKRLNLPEKDLTLRNQIYSSIYDASLAYKAALMQGKKRGRSFLLHLQKALADGKTPYSNELLAEVAAKAKLDVDMFFEDKESPFVKSSYEADQHIAQEMNIKTNPSLVIFDNLNYQYGLLLEDNITAEVLHEVIKDCSVACEQKSANMKKTNITTIGKNYIRITH